MKAQAVGTYGGELGLRMALWNKSVQLLPCCKTRYPQTATERPAPPDTFPAFG
jgi:hypothetical protein